jgi:streptogramin lyase
VPGAAAPDAIALGPDGALWFSEPLANEIGRISDGGAMTEYPIAASGSEPEAIIAGPDGALWFVQPGTNDVGRISSAGAVTEVSIAVGACSAGPGSGPVGIASGANGELWVTEDRDSPGEIAEIDPSTDVVSQNCLSYDMPYAIVPGSDGALWFTYGDDDIARITTGGSTSAIPASSASSALMPIVSGPDGNLWIGISGSPAELERLSVTDVATPFTLPSGSSASVARIGVGPDGQLWLAGGGALTSISTSGAFTEYPGVYPAGDAIAGIAAGPGDTLWLTDASAATIDRVALGTPSIGAALGPVSGVARSSAVVSATLDVPAGALAQDASYSFDYGPTAAYGSVTAPASAIATPAGTAVQATLTGLTPNTTYHYRLVASGCAPSSCQAATGDQSFTSGLALTPVQGRSVALAPVSGRVLVRRAHTRRFVRLRRGELVAVGSTVNARRGRVLIESAVAGAPAQVASGIFHGGIFTVSQPSGQSATTLALRSSFKRCRARPARARVARARRGHRSKKVVNEVFGTAHGQYTTRGHYAAAADEGTSWRLADRCDGTYVAVSAGQVDVSDFVHHRSLVLGAGRHYLASPR